MDTFDNAPRFTIDACAPSPHRGPLLFAFKLLSLLLAVSTVGVGGAKVVSVVYESLQPETCPLTFEQFIAKHKHGHGHEHNGQVVDWIIPFDYDLTRVVWSRNPTELFVIHVTKVEPRELLVDVPMRITGTLWFFRPQRFEIKDVHVLEQPQPQGELNR